jgi:hypothetical protein
MLLIHGPTTPRARYTFEVVLGRILRVPFRVTEDASEVRRHEGPALWYGEAPGPEGVPFVRARALLLETGVRAQDPEPFPWEGTLALFPTADPASALPFDPFAASFYLVSRYEEYLPGPLDLHGRFPPERSVLAGALRQPVVDRYAAHLRALLAARYPEASWPEPSPSACSTVDVDVAYAYRGRPPLRTAGATLRGALRGELRDRLRTLTGLAPDPHDTFDWLEARHREAGVPSLYFFLVSEGGPLDRNLDPRGRAMRELVGRLAAETEVGLHPSYASHADPSRLDREASALAALTGRPVTKSRQHFLRFTLPETYRALLRAGIRDEYSMGYAAEPGFRAGTAHPFPFYDLGREEATPLTVHPLAYMDGTLREYRGMDPEEASATVGLLAEAVRQTGGAFVSLWHNQTVNDRADWQGWQRVFVDSLAAASALQRGPRAAGGEPPPAGG